MTDRTVTFTQTGVTIPGDWYEMENGGEFSIAGWQADVGNFHDVEKGQEAFEDSPYDEADLEIVVFHYKDASGADAYFTIYGPFDDLDSLEDIIDDVLDRYCVV